MSSHGKNVMLVPGVPSASAKKKWYVPESS